VVEEEETPFAAQVAALFRAEQERPPVPAALTVRCARCDDAMVAEEPLVADVLARFRCPLCLSVIEVVSP
jgi:hypothetical protein